MSVYIIVSYDISDPAKFEPYVPGVVPLLQKHGAEILVADFAPKTVEGQGRGVNVVLRFESEEKALAFYNDPAYQPVKQIRLDSTANGTMTLAQEFVFPSA